MIGEVALAIGALWSLEDTETLLRQLEKEGRVQKMTGTPIRYEMTKPAV